MSEKKILLTNLKGGGEVKIDIYAIYAGGKVEIYNKGSFSINSNATWQTVIEGGFLKSIAGYYDAYINEGGNISYPNCISHSESVLFAAENKDIIVNNIVYDNYTKENVYNGNTPFFSLPIVYVKPTDKVSDKLFYFWMQVGGGNSQ